MQRCPWSDNAVRQILQVSDRHQRAGDVAQIINIVDEEYALFYSLFHRTAQFKVDYPLISIKEKLQCPENFDRIELISPVV